MFRKLTVIEPVNLVDRAAEELKQYAGETAFYEDVPADEDEIVRRIGDSDAVLLSYTSQISARIFERCPKIRYVGMCCSLYSKESANVDIAWAEKHGVCVKGIRDYGDRGVVEFVLCELIRFLHGYDRPLWRQMPTEITGLKAGVVGLGVSGGMIAEALRFMGADVSYYSRTRKPEKEDGGIVYRDLHDLLRRCDAVFTCLNRNVLLLGKDEFRALGNGKLLFNTSIGPSFEPEDLEEWLDSGPNIFICDTKGALGDPALAGRAGVYCADRSAGRTSQSFELLSRKVLDNIRKYFAETGE